MREAWWLVRLWLRRGDFLRVGTVTLARGNIAGVVHDEGLARVFLRQPLNNAATTVLVYVDVTEPRSRRRLRIWLGGER
jgi:hypothetical protein